MASPMPFQPAGGWNNDGQAMPPSNPPEEPGVRARTVGLKVLYRLDKEEKFDCLARPRQTFNVQTMPLDETTTVGVIDLRACIQAVIECSPELPGKECDYTIYVHDCSEPDTPLVGQGMLSSALHSLQYDMNGQTPKMVTGLVTQNKLGLIMGNANRETLEVKMKLTETPRSHQPHHQQQQHPQLHYHGQHYPQQQHDPQQPQMDMAPSRPMEAALTPTGAAEWNSFMHSNPHIGQPSHAPRVASPALSQGPPQGPPQAMPENRDAFTHHPPLQPMPPQEAQRIAPIPVDQPSEGMNIPRPSSRPSSRASNRGPARRRAPTGRPRGRPRKKPVEGNTSGYEDGTEGEDGPAKKRAKTTVVDKSNSNPFGTEPESLRVAASTSGSLRNFRPIAMSQEGSAASHLQDVPRAPTPVPHGPFPGRGPKKGPVQRGSAMSREASTQRMRALSPSQDDGRSPESMAPTPAFSDDSAGDIGSSPPVPRTASFMHSSPPPSSPMLPPMLESQAPQDDMADAEDVVNMFGDESAQPAPARLAKIAPAPPRKSKVGVRRSSTTIPMQIFRMEDGPKGQDMVHMCSLNTPDPQKSRMSLSQMPHQQAPPIQQGPRSRSAFGAPTPPQTTDATEKPTSPPIQPQVPRQNTPTLEGAPPVQPQEISMPGASVNPIEQPQTSGQEDVSTKAADAAGAQPELPASANNSGKGTARSGGKKPEPRPRKLARSHSAGALLLPTVPASEPAGPSSLSQSTTIDITHQPSTDEQSSHVRRAQSTGPLSLPVPASDPVGPPPSTRPPSSLALPEPVSVSVPLDVTVPPPPSSPHGERSNKNVVKKNAIKQRLEAAIQRGEMPPYCSNCGAIETPTWRKIYAQEHSGVPATYPPGELSTKPGMVTAVEITARDSEERPTSYRLVKKALGPEEERDTWQELLLCNPCGIWLGKCFSHRPPDRWDGDAARLGRERRKRSAEPREGGNARSRKSRSKSHSMTMGSAVTDASGPAVEDSTPKDASTTGATGPSAQGTGARGASAGAGDSKNSSATGADGNNAPGAGAPAGNKAAADASGEMDDAMGSTKRLLFPSPQKDNSPKALGEVDVNSVYGTGECRQRKELTAQKENVAATEEERPLVKVDDLEDLFRSPMPPRPSTPPSRARAAPPTTPFKTPTRATPSHRPVTRSVSRSIRSKESATKAGSEFQRTPSQTPTKMARLEVGVTASASKRRSPRIQSNHGVDFDDIIFDTPISRAVNQMLSEPNFGLEDEMELVGLGSADNNEPNWANFSSFFSTDVPMPSSPPKDRMTFDPDNTTEWAPWGMEHMVDASHEE